MVRTIILATGLVFGMACSGWGATYYAASGSSGAGTSWADAYGSLDAALAAAVSGDTVLVAEGTYVPSGASFNVAAGVTVKGGWCNYWTSYGTVTQIGEFYNPKTYQAFLSGDTNGNDQAANLYGNPDALDAMASRAENKGTILTLAGSATVDGLFFWNGGATLGGAVAGGIQCGAGGTVVVNNCEFYGCLGSNGAAVAGSSATVTVSHCYFQGNASSSAMVRSAGPLTVTNCTFKGNSNSGEYGNGIRWDTAAGATLTVNDCAVIDSISGADSAFGSLYIRGGSNATIDVSRCTFRNDEADGSSTFMYNSGSTAVQTYNFTNCLWAGCEGNTGNGTILIRPRYAGAVTTLNILNCTVADNHDAGLTAGIKAYAGSNLANTSFVLNLKNSILWDNAGTDIIWDSTSLSFTDTTYNPFDISYCCINTADHNYGEYPIPWKDPTTQVVLNPQFVGGGDYHLQSTPPCIDKGDPASSYANAPMWLNGCRVNMGAYGNTKEAATTTTCVALTADTNGDCRVNNADLLTLRGQWLKTCP